MLSEKVEPSIQTNNTFPIHQKEFEGSSNDANQKNGSSSPHKVDVFEIYSMGIVIVIGGQLFAWNEGLNAGILLYFGCLIIIATGYVLLSLCLSELCGIFPFSGGAYGFVRVALGTYCGFLVGCLENMEYVLYVSASVVQLGYACIYIIGCDASYQPLFWLLFYGSALAIQIRGGPLLWQFVVAISVVSLLLIALFICAALNNANFAEYVQHEDASHHTVNQFMQYLPLASWFFIGVESIPLTCSETNNATTVVPKAMINCIITLVVTSIPILFLTISNPPGITEIQSATAPLNYVYSNAFNISDELATILSIPALYGTAFGFMFAYGKQMNAMSKSGLLPAWLSKDFGTHRTPYTALIISSTVSFGIIVISYLFFSLDNLDIGLFNTSVLSAYLVYFAIFVTYLIFLKRFSTLERRFRNPLGVVGAVTGILIFLLGTIALLFFQAHERHVYFVIIILMVCTTYFYFVAKHHQNFSKEEQTLLLIAYIIKSNITSRMKSKRGVLKRSNSSTSSLNTVMSKTVSRNEKQITHRDQPLSMDTPLDATNSEFYYDDLPSYRSFYSSKEDDSLRSSYHQLSLNKLAKDSLAVISSADEDDLILERSMKTFKKGMDLHYSLVVPIQEYPDRHNMDSDSDMVTRTQSHDIVESSSPPWSRPTNRNDNPSFQLENQVRRFDVSPVPQRKAYVTSQPTKMMTQQINNHNTCDDESDEIHEDRSKLDLNLTGNELNVIDLTDHGGPTGELLDAMETQTRVVHPVDDHMGTESNHWMAFQDENESFQSTQDGFGDIEDIIRHGVVDGSGSLVTGSNWSESNTLQQATSERYRMKSQEAPHPLPMRRNSLSVVMSNVSSSVLTVARNANRLEAFVKVAPEFNSLPDEDRDGRGVK